MTQDGGRMPSPGRGAMPLGALRTRLANVWGGDGPRTVVTPEPVGFLAATLCYELLRDDPGTEPSFAHGIGLWAAAHPVAAAGLLPIRTGLIEKLATATDRRREPLLWASLQQQLGNALMRSHPDDPAPVLDRVVAVLQAALAVFTRTDHPAAWAATQHSLGVAYKEVPAGSPAPISNGLSGASARRCWSEPARRHRANGRIARSC